MMQDHRFGGLVAVALLGWAGLAQAQEIIVSHGISTFGDLKYPADFAHLDYVNPNAPKGGEVSQSAPGGFDSLNPYSIKGVGAALSTVMHESILAGTADEIGASYCLMCTTIEYPQDRSWVIFNLRDDVKFSDGSAMTAEDVIFSYELLRDKGLSDFRTILGQQIEKAEILEPLKVKFTFKAGFPTRDLPELAGGLPIFSKAQYERDGLDLEEQTLKPYMGTGPYMFDSMDVGRTVIYRRNPDYWGKDLPINIGRHNLDRIRIEYFADSNAAFEAFKAGEFTFRQENSSKFWAEGYKFPAVQSGVVQKKQLRSGVKASNQGFLFNLRKEKFQDPKVRQAIELMFNFEWTNRTLFFGLYSRVNSFWENSWLAATGLPSEAEVALLKPLVDEGLLDATILTEEPVLPNLGGERQLDRASLRKASALLDEAGWEVGTDGLRRNAKGETLDVEFLNDDPQFDRIINPFVENLAALGVNAKVTKVDDAQMELRTRPPRMDFDIVTGHTPTDYFPGSGLMQYFGSETADDSAFNIMGLKNPAVDRLIRVVMEAKTKDELTTATMALDRVMRQARFVVPQWYNNQYWVAYYDMYEYPSEDKMPPYALGVMDFWWVNAEKAAALKASGALK
ncbi:ABC transporter substrate-binding protein [Gemmobacter tilapiae]|uniref:ABC transporter substrate-binding protein n=2 Tax=Neogemmobacter tilapiae TaxID=875041 RepID=A0A918TVH6_9RHOB|nr:ABC transporter substrate-binding protein [Gemmobacter tilapiae]